MTTLRIRAQVRKELTQIRRDRLGLMLALGLPMILLACSERPFLWTSAT